MRKQAVTTLMLTLGMGLCLAAQAPPANAVDITASAPSAQIAAPPAVLRIYIDTLAGSDASAVQALLTQALFESKKVVITENQSNASLVLKGQVRRQLPAAPKPARRTAARRSSRSAAPAGTDLPANVTNLDSLDAASTLTSPMLLDANPTVDLSKYQYRLDLELVNPQGDLVWMSGQGDQAPSFAAAQTAVQTTVTPLLAALAAMTPAATSPH